jgi:hypothetical protein
VEETSVHGENHRPVASNWQTFCEIKFIERIAFSFYSFNHFLRKWILACIFKNKTPVLSNFTLVLFSLIFFYIMLNYSCNTEPNWAHHPDYQPICICSCLFMLWLAEKQPNTIFYNMWAGLGSNLLSSAFVPSLIIFITLSMSSSWLMTKGISSVWVYTPYSVWYKRIIVG